MILYICRPFGELSGWLSEGLLWKRSPDTSGESVINWRVVRVAEGARLESVYTGNCI